MSNPSGGEGIDIGQLSVQQLSAVKKQLDEEIEHLTTSYGKLRAAQSKFRDCNRSLETALKPANEGKAILVPLTSSLYVPGQMAKLDKAIIDVGTGFYVEKTKDAATTFYNARIEELGNNLKDLESIVQGKQNNLKMVEEVFRQKVLSSNAAASSSASSVASSNAAAATAAAAAKNDPGIF